MVDRQGDVGRVAIAKVVGKADDMVTRALRCVVHYRTIHTRRQGHRATYVSLTGQQRRAVGVPAIADQMRRQERFQQEADAAKNKKR